MQVRLIDANALDAAFTDLRFSADGTLAHWGDRPDWCLHGSEVEKLIENAPTIGGWTSVKDRMPEQAGYRCLVSAEYGDGKRTVFTAFTGYGEPGWWTYESVYMEKVRESDNRVHHNYHITHWMPLPEPPTGDKS